jgi:hypothetical protein
MSRWRCSSWRTGDKFFKPLTAFMERALSLVSALTVEQVEGGNAGRGEAAERDYVAGSTFRRPQVQEGPRISNPVR